MVVNNENSKHIFELDDEINTAQSPPGYPIPQNCRSSGIAQPPPAFFSIFASTIEKIDVYEAEASKADPSDASAKFESEKAEIFSLATVSQAKTAPLQDIKGSSEKREETSEPPPAYSKGSSPLESFTYLMAATGGAASILTQVQQGGPAPLSTLGDVGPDEIITMELRCRLFTLSRDELLTLPEFVLLSLFPNGLLPDGQLNNFDESDAFQVDYDPASLQYMLDFFRNVAQTITSRIDPSFASSDNDTMYIDPLKGAPCEMPREMLRDRAGIIVLREDLDFYVIPPRADIEQLEMMEVKRAAGRALVRQDGIFSGLKRTEDSENGTTEQHLIEMLTAGGFDHDDRWGHRAVEPSKAVICSLALARLRSDTRGEMGSNAVGMAQKLLLFWRKPARRCWWEGLELENVEGVEGKLKVWIRRVWTLEMSVIGLR